MEQSLSKSGNNNMNSFFGKISETTKSNPASNVTQLKTAGSNIKVGRKDIPYNRKDEIFELKGPTKHDYQGDSCKL